MLVNYWIQYNGNDFAVLVQYILKAEFIIFCSINYWRDFEIFIAVFIAIFAIMAMSVLCTHLHTLETNIFFGSETQMHLQIWLLWTTNIFTLYYKRYICFKLKINSQRWPHRHLHTYQNQIIIHDVNEQFSGWKVIWFVKA